MVLECRQAVGRELAGSSQRIKNHVSWQRQGGAVAEALELDLSGVARGSVNISRDWKQDT